MHKYTGNEPIEREPAETGLGIAGLFFLKGGAPGPRATPEDDLDRFIADHHRLYCGVPMPMIKQRIDFRASPLAL